MSTEFGEAQNNQKVHEDSDASAEAEDVNVLAFEHNGFPAVRVSAAPVDAAWEPTTIAIFAMEEGSLQEMFDDRVSGTVTLHDNGSFTVQETYCYKAARLKYSLV